ncbi:MAG: PrsW family intramembrane metalloprotease [Halobacteriaceae archaeon]
MTPRKVLRVARWEVSRSAGELDRRALVAVLALALVAAALAPTFASGVGEPNRGIYRVAVDESSPYYPAVRYGRPLRPVPPGSEAEVTVRETGFSHAATPRGRAAMAALREAVVAYNDRRMRSEPDEAAAFPVHVSLRYLERGPSPAGGDGAGTGSGQPTAATDSGDRSGDGATGDGASDETTPGDDATPVPPLPSGGSGGGPLGGPQEGTPAGIRPPFPLQSLVVAFLFVLPLNPVAQSYGSTIMNERLDRRGELLLVSPLSRGDIVAGKTLPYAVAALAVTAAIAAVVGGGVVTVAAVAPVVALMLAASFVAGMFARSFRELTFLTMTASVLVTAYVFVPAVFTDVHPIAAISPLSVVVARLTGAPLGAGTFLFATLPMTLAAAVLFGLGLGVYREEDMFTQLPLPAKVLDALAAHLTRRRVPAWSALAVPFVFVAELFAIAVLFVVPVAVSLPLLLGVVAVIEEVAKSLHVFAGFERARYPRGVRSALLVGALSGVGFALGEKFALAAQVVGLPDLELGRVAFAPAAATDPALVAVLLVAPFALHAATAATSALGARRSFRAYLLALAAAALVHVAYNLAVVSALA